MEKSSDSQVKLQAPFPWFGGKSRVADLVWSRLGDVRNYVEPFFGSGAVLLGRPTEPKIETINDLDRYVANFWRAVQADPEAVAHHCDWPVNEADLESRHYWLVSEGVVNWKLGWLTPIGTMPRLPVGGFGGCLAGLAADGVSAMVRGSSVTMAGNGGQVALVGDWCI